MRKSIDLFKNLHFFSWEQGIFLVKLLLAHLISESGISEEHRPDERLTQKDELLHVGAIHVSTAVLTGWWMMAVIVVIGHWGVDRVKVWMDKERKGSRLYRLVVDQGLHLLLLFVIWVWELKHYEPITRLFTTLWSSYPITLLLLGYVFVTSPVGILIGRATSGLVTGDPGTSQASTATQRGGRYIGIYERIIILTLVLLGEYEAIGFLVAAKGIIRFASHNEDIRSEYVRVGTMMSYAFAILTGVLLNWLLSIK